jgi:hypothetical protein
MEGWPLETKMIPVAILGFLTGAVLAWGFRVWILLPVTLLAFFAKMIFELIVGRDFLPAIGVSLVIGLVPQLGYAFGLFARSALAALRSSRKAPVDVLGKHRSIEGT